MHFPILNARKWPMSQQLGAFFFFLKQTVCERKGFLGACFWASGPWVIWVVQVSAIEADVEIWQNLPCYLREIFHLWDLHSHACCVMLCLNIYPLCAKTKWYTQKFLLSTKCDRTEFSSCKLLYGQDVILNWHLCTELPLQSQSVCSCMWCGNQVYTSEIMHGVG